MKKIKPLLIILIFVLLLPISIHLFAKHKSTTNIKNKFSELLYEYESFDDELPVIDLSSRPCCPTKDNSISKNEAFEDIDYLFSLLKYGYSAYEYFGGDEIFISAKENMKNSVINLEEDNISITKFTDILYSELNFIQDSHFILGNYKLCNYTKYYSSRKLTFYKDKIGFYLFIGYEPFYLKEIKEGNISNYMKPSLDINGKIIYNIGVLSDTKEVSIPINLVLESKNSSRNMTISLFEYKPINKDKVSSYRYYEINNIPILELNCLCRVTPEDKTIEEFIKDSKKMRKKDNFIIDLRNNIGGNIINIENWFKGFTGTSIGKDIIQSGLYTNTSISLSKDKFKTKENETESVLNHCLEEVISYEKEQYFPGWSNIEYKKSRKFKNKSNIIVLIDKNTSSAAEFFVYHLKNIGNVTLIGTNSNGCLLTGNNNLAHLPQSNISLSISHKLYVHPSFISVEGLGIMPDLWVKPDQALDRAVNYIKKSKK
jgi:hypothetical protein